MYYRCVWGGVSIHTMYAKVVKEGLRGITKRNIKDIQRSLRGYGIRGSVGLRGSKGRGGHLEGYIHLPYPSSIPPVAMLTQQSSTLIDQFPTPIGLVFVCYHVLVRVLRRPRKLCWIKIDACILWRTGGAVHGHRGRVDEE